MIEIVQPASDSGVMRQRGRLLHALARTTFVSFFQGHMVAPRRVS